LVLFLDIEGAFPNTITDQLLHNMKKQGLPLEIVRFTERLLDDRKTKLRFNEYKSEWFPLRNGIGQGDPLSMLLYVIYSSDLVDTERKKMESLRLSSTYDLCLASGCYSDEKEDKSDGRRYNSERRRCKSNVEEDKSYRGGVQHLKKRKEDVGGEGIGFSLCAAPLDRLSPHISEERSYNGGGGGVGVGVESEEELRVRQKQDEDGALLIFVLRYKEIHRDLYTN